MEVVVDAGHGGTDPGASSGSIVEKDYNLLISNYQYDRFRQLGIPVARTRSTDETISSTERVRIVLESFGDNPDVVVLSNHFNAGGGDGAEFIYALRNNDTLPRIMAEEIAKAGQNVRKWYQRRMPSDTSKDYYYILRETGQTHPVLIEYGFLDGPASEVNLIKNNWKDLAEAIVRAVAIYAGVPYTAPTVEGQYVVQSGDSLYSIARKFGVTVDAIKIANNLTSNTLQIGQRLVIPTYVPPEQSNITYVVQRDDSLYSIATTYKVTVDAIKRANNLTSNTLQIGQVLKIPTTSVPSTTPSTYTVKSGDSLYSIAQKLGVTVDALKSANNLTSNTLRIGQVLKIPGATTTIPGEEAYIMYTVKSGDSLYSIASNYGVSVTEIKTLNNLTSNLLSIGQVLKIPRVDKYVETEPGEAIFAFGNRNTYTVQRGDSLYSIANKYGISPDELKNINNLTSNILTVGQVIIIPVTENTAPTTETYIVQRGDSLWNIATRYNISVEELKSLNNLTSDLLVVGQILAIPAVPVLGLTTYTVQNGDTLWSISNKYDTTVEEIKRLNNLSDNFITVGQVLTVSGNGLYSNNYETERQQTPPSSEELPLIIRYTVQKGDSLWSIAKRFNVSAALIRDLNNLQTEILRIGQEILVPTKTAEITSPIEPNITVYIVKKGDTLWSVAKRFGVTIGRIKELNNLTSDMISIGQQLLVPITPGLVPSPDTIFYIVQKGDTLYAIARKYNITPDELKQINNLTSDIIGVGDILTIPIRKQE